MLIGVSYSAVAKTNLGHKRAKWSVSPTHVTTPFSSTLPSLELDSTTSTLRKTPADQIFRPPCTQMISKTSRFSFESTLTNSFLSKHWAVESETLKMSGGRWSWLHGLIQTHSSFITTVASGKFWSSVLKQGEEEQRHPIGSLSPPTQSLPRQCHGEQSLPMGVWRISGRMETLEKPWEPLHEETSSQQSLQLTQCQTF